MMMNVNIHFSSLPTFSPRILGALLVLLLLAGCATRQPVPVERRQPDLGDDYVIVNGVRQPRSALPGSRAAAPQAAASKDGYIVRQGDTLYSIAMQNDLDPQDVAVWNRISDPSKIAVGQEIRLTPPTDTQGGVGMVTTAPLQTVPPVGASPATTTPGAAAAASTDGAVKMTPKAIKEPYSEQKLAAMTAAEGTNTTTTSPQAVTSTTPQTTPQTTTAPAAASTATVGGLSWTWPTQGRVISNFSNSASLKGIDVAGAIGQPVVASAAGRVVYVGSGLRGYGNLIIVKHNDVYLSVYAHNKELLVKQGQQVARGQKIAEMGNSDANQVKLHFEVRENGKPVDPLKFLPAK